MRAPRLTRTLAAVLGGNVAALGLVAVAAFGLAGCETIQPGARTLRAAYCNGVSAGGRAAIATLATGQPDTVIRCDNVPGAPPAAATSPAQIVVVIKPGDLVATPAPELRGPIPADPAPSVPENPPS